jgi:hypothetical protein
MAATPKATTGKKLPKNKHAELVRVGYVDSSSWRVRDMAHRLLFHRYGPENETVAPRHPLSQIPMSASFDGDTCLARIRRDKAGVVRSSFDVAATAVLEAVEKTLEQHQKKLRRKRVTYKQEDLPPFLTQWLQLEELRVTSLERARNNKEYAKRKGPMDARTGKNSSALGTEGNAKKPKAEKADKKGSNASKEAPKFTRNTPASSAAALDFRSTNSRAILCTAGNVSFESLTPFLPGFTIDVTDIPQNPTKQAESGSSSSATVNMGNVVVEAQTLGQRAIAVALNAVRRAARRYQYRKDNIQFDSKPDRNKFFRMKNPFALKGPGDEDEDDAATYLEEAYVPYQPHEDSITEFWTDECLPRFLSILETGAGHALYHDVQWTSRHGRITNLFQALAEKKDNYGTHLIITTEPEVARFAQEFQPVNSHQALLHTVNAESLRALAYTGDKEQRRRLRHFFPKATGLVDSPYHVLITSYASFLENYLHFCQVPFEVVVVDDGASWMAAAQGDPNSPIGTLWETAIWSTKDQQIGLAGTSFRRWNFMTDDPDPKDAWIGLTARNRVLTASQLKVTQRNSSDVIPVSGLVDFVAPHFATAVREEWDRSRIHTDAASMSHFRKLLTRSTVVHHPDSEYDSMFLLAMNGLTGSLPPPANRRDPEVPRIITEEEMVNDGKVAFSRRSSLAWLGPPDRSWLRYELGKVPFQPIIDAMNRSSSYGHFCEEIITASSTTSTGATGQVAGTLAYRLAIRCNRHFGSEQGLRQHLSALHAPPGTWLCRTCGTDCVTSQARTHHERSCGQPSAAAGGDQNEAAAPGGRQHYGPVGVVGKKKGQRGNSLAQGGSAPEDKEADGSFRIPGYRGVWVNPQGKHFVKLKGKRLTAPGSDETLFFDSIEEAAKGHDNAVKVDGSDAKAELNFQEDGTRIVYEDVTTSSTTGLGGSASNVVPALSVINIKVGF